MIINHQKHGYNWLNTPNQSQLITNSTKFLLSNQQSLDKQVNAIKQLQNEIRSLGLVFQISDNDIAVTNQILATQYLANASLLTNGNYPLHTILKDFI
jgi:TATA-box binding protein (TBP) (component of TFIID and TFIIIB)